MYACLKFKWARNWTSILTAASTGGYVLSRSHLFTELKLKTNQKQLLQQGIFFLGFGDLKNVQEIQPMLLTNTCLIVNYTQITSLKSSSSPLKNHRVLLMKKVKHN